MSAGRARSGRGWTAAIPLIALALASACSNYSQRADDEFRLPKVAKTGAVKASATNRPPHILFDHSHQNFHRIDGRYRPFAELVKSAGFEIRATEGQFDHVGFGNADVVVIANAMPPPEAPHAPPFSDRELDAIEGFVLQGGGLLLITDIPPYGTASRTLAGRFGVRLSGGIVIDPEHQSLVVSGPGNLLFTREDGLLGAHPILDGTSPADRVNVVATFRGQALFAPPRATTLLRFAPHAVHVPIEISTVMTKFGPDAVRTQGRKTRVGGGAQAVALEHGLGRVVITGEAAAFTAQVTGTDVKFGMNLDGTDNARFAVNTLRWLSRR